jgi:hypothetical protein
MVLEIADAREGTNMSQSNVERVIGLLATDEVLRRRFAEDPRATLEGLVHQGVELTSCEFHALLGISPRRLARFAGALDPRLQKADLQGGK